MQKLKHIKYTKLSPILSETVRSRATLAGDFFSVMRLLESVRWESPPSNLVKATRKPDVLVLSEIHE